MPSPDSTIQYSINVYTQTGTRQSTLKTEEVDRGMTYMYNLIMQEVAFRAVKGKEDALTRSIDSTFKAIVEMELKRMARKIGQLIFVKDSAAKARTGYLPRGQLEIVGNTSQAMQGLTSPVKLSTGTGYWPARNYKYLQKRKKMGGGNWFKVTGELKSYLTNAGAYTQAYGPIKVKYTKAPKGTPLPQGKMPVTKMGVGVGGRRSTDITFGNVEVSALGSITSDMINSPDRMQPKAWSTGLFESFPDKIERKLLNREEAYRPFLEQFLAFYMTRAIPNAVFRRIEDVMYAEATLVGSRKVATAKKYSGKNLKSLSEQLKPILK